MTLPVLEPRSNTLDAIEQESTMGETTKIAWCDHTFNPWWGCSKVSAGCAHCYAEAQAQRFERDRGLWGPTARRRLTGDGNWREPERWNAKAARDGVRRRVFCASMADVFEDRADLDPHRVRLFDLIHRTPHLDWLLLTKRPESIRALLIRAMSFARVSAAPGCQDEPPKERPTAWWLSSWLDGYAPPNVWLGTTAEDQRAADERVPALLSIPARVRFLSCEPLLGPVDLEGDGAGTWIPGGTRGGLSTGVSWVIVGGESGPRARPCDVGWIDNLRKQCARTGVPVFVKQLGAAPVSTARPDPKDGLSWLMRVTDIKGGDPDEWPEHLRVRQLPVPP